METKWIDTYWAAHLCGQVWGTLSCKCDWIDGRDFGSKASCGVKHRLCLKVSRAAAGTRVGPVREIMLHGIIIRRAEAPGRTADVLDASS